jgi:hypothetical protein
MKKLPLLFLVVLALGAFLQSCNDSKTYAEMLEDERNAVSKFIKKHNIKTISLSEFEKDTVTNVAENEYVELSSGYYLQIIDRGEGDTIKNRDEILVRMIEYNIMAEIDENVIDTISNIDIDNVVDCFYYTPDKTSILFNDGYFPYVYVYNMNVSYLDVPKGIITALPYLRNNAHIKLIVPSKLGHNYAMQQVNSFYYEIRKVQIR